MNSMPSCGACCGCGIGGGDAVGSKINNQNCERERKPPEPPTYRYRTIFCEVWVSQRLEGTYLYQQQYHRLHIFSPMHQVPHAYHRFLYWYLVSTNTNEYCWARGEADVLKSLKITSTGNRIFVGGAAARHRRKRGDPAGRQERTNARSLRETSSHAAAAGSRSTSRTCAKSYPVIYSTSVPVGPSAMNTMYVHG